VAKESGSLASLKKGFTKRAIILGIILEMAVLLCGFQQGFTNLDISLDVSSSNLFPSSFVLFFILLIALKLLAKTGVIKPFSIQELTVIFSWISATVVVTFATAIGRVKSFYSWYAGYILATRIQDAAKSNFGNLVPSWWTPSESALKAGLYGGASVPWGEWIPPIAFWLFLGALTITFSYSITLIMRKRWIEEERWTFPFAQIGEELINFMAEGVKQKENKKILRSLYAGFLVGFLWSLPRIINTYAPSVLPNIPGTAWYVNDLGQIYPAIFAEFWNIDPAMNGMPWDNIINIVINGSLTPWLICLFLLVPIDVLNTAVLISFLMYVVLLPLLTLAGVIPLWSFRMGYNQYGSFAYGGVFPWQQGRWNPIMPGIVFDFGGMVGLGIFTIIFNREYIARTIKALFGKTPSELEEEKEPLPYRYAWLACIASGILLFLMFALAIGAPWHVALIGLVFMAIFLVAGARMRGEAGYGSFFMYFENSRGIFNDLFGYSGWYHAPITSLSESTPDFFATQVVHDWTVVQNVNFSNGYVSAMLDVYKIGYDSNTNPKEIFKSSVIATVIALLLFVPLALIREYHVGLINTNWGSTMLSAPVNFRYDPSWWHYAPLRDAGEPSPLIHVLIGVIIMGLVMYARTKWIWFPLNPAGLIIGNSSMCLGNVGFLPFGVIFVAWLIKIIIYKAVGGGFFRERVQPFAIGFLVCWFLGILIVRFSDFTW